MLHQSLLQTAQIALEEFEKVSFSLVTILRMESQCKSGRGEHQTIQLNARNT